MIEIVCNAGESFTDGTYPPQWILAHAANGVATLLKIDNPEETLDDLRQRAVKIQRMKRARNARLDSKHRKC